MKGLASSTEPFGPVFIHSFIHLENLYSAASRKLLRGAPSPTTMKKISFKPLVEQRCVGLALWYSNRICEGSEFQIHFPSLASSLLCSAVRQVLGFHILHSFLFSAISL